MRSSPPARPDSHGSTATTTSDPIRSDSQGGADEGDEEQAALDDPIHISSSVRSFRLGSRDLHSFSRYDATGSRKALIVLVVATLTLVAATAGAATWYLSFRTPAAAHLASLHTPQTAPPQPPTHKSPTPHKPARAHKSKPKHHLAPPTHPRKHLTKPTHATKVHKKPKPAHHASKGLLTATGAQQAFSATWTSFAVAANSGDTATLNQLATQSVVDVVDANRACNCGQMPISFTSVDITAPAETAYPLSFAAEIDGARGANGPFMVVVIMHKASSAASWQVGWVAKYAGTTPTLTPGTKIGVAGPVVVLGMLTNPILLLAQLFGSLRSIGKAPAGNIWNGDLNAAGTEPSDTAGLLVAAQRAAVARHVSGSISYWATNFSPPFASASGFLECGQIEATINETPARGSVLVQPPNHSVYGAMLAAGNYVSVSALEARDFCVNVSSADVVAAAGLTGGTFSVTGNPS